MTSHLLRLASGAAVVAAISCGSVYVVPPPTGTGATGSGATGGGPPSGGSGGGETVTASTTSTSSHTGSATTKCATTTTTTTPTPTSPCTLGFASPVAYAAGAWPTSLAAGDLNGDGMPDLAVGNTTGQTVSVLLNKGDGTFAAHVDYPVGQNFGSIAMADLNCDGRADLATTTGNSVSVLMNQSDGTFAAPATFPLAAPSGSIAATDLNGDGLPDLVIGSNVGGSAGGQTYGDVGVLLNQGGGTFSTDVEYLSSSACFAIATGDVNGDGRPDIVVGDVFTSAVSVLINNGDGTFATRVDYPTDSYPISIAVADVNGDGKADLVMAIQDSSGTATLDVLLNNGDGTFAPKVSYDEIMIGTAVAVADLNGDGKPDIVVGATADSSGSVLVLLNNGDGTFGTPLQFPVGSILGSISVSDVNGDGKPDIVAVSVNDADPMGGSVYVLMSTCAP